jgi:hypothetical protein
VVPLSIAVAITLLLLGRSRIALIWTGVTLAVWATMLLLKFSGYTLEHVDPSVSSQWGLVTASGHVAAAATAYGALAGLLFGPPATAVRRSGLVALAAAVLIAATRIFLREHTLSETVVGALVGVPGAAAIAALARDTIHGRPRTVLLAAAVVTVFALHGSHLTWEQYIAAASARVVQAWR